MPIPIGILRHPPFRVAITRPSPIGSSARLPPPPRSQPREETVTSSSTSTSSATQDRILVSASSRMQMLTAAALYYSHLDQKTITGEAGKYCFSAASRRPLGLLSWEVDIASTPSSFSVTWIFSASRSMAAPLTLRRFPTPATISSTYQ